jgi:hypothetical protein
MWAPQPCAHTRVGKEETLGDIVIVGKEETLGDIVILMTSPDSHRDGSFTGP